MSYQKLEPSEDLQDVIKSFWYINRRPVETSHDFEVLPDGYAEIVFHFGDGCSITRDSGIQALSSPFIVGMLEQPVIFHAEKELQLIGIKCYPWAVFDLLGLPASNLAITAFKHPIAALQQVLEPIIKEGNAREALEMVRQWCRDAKSNIATNSMLYKAGIAMRAANGALPVSQVASAAHASVRTLEREFKRSSGHTVKNVSSLIRFEKVRDKLSKDPDTNIAGLAQEVGYSDQSHLNREFKKYSGVTAAAFAREAKRRKKIIGNDFVAFVLA